MTLLSPVYDETYHSAHGAVTEARWVYLEGSGVAARLREGRPTRVVEVGFGTGLNTLVTGALARRTGTPVDLLSLERDLLEASALGSLEQGAAVDDAALEAALLAWRAALPAHPPDGDYRAAFGPLTLTLRVGDAVRAPLPSEVDAVYHDGFSPQRNPELWEPAFLARLAGALAPGGTLVSYTVRGAVRRALSEAGLEVAKRPGPPGGKREVLFARRPGGGA